MVNPYDPKYIVKQGDTLSKIAGSLGTTVEALAKANDIAEADYTKLAVGQALKTYDEIKVDKTSWAFKDIAQTQDIPKRPREIREQFYNDVRDLNGMEDKVEYAHRGGLKVPLYYMDPADPSYAFLAERAAEKTVSEPEAKTDTVQTDTVPPQKEDAPVQNDQNPAEEPAAQEEEQKEESALKKEFKAKVEETKEETKKKYSREHEKPDYQANKDANQDFKIRGGEISTHLYEDPEQPDTNPYKENYFLGVNVLTRMPVFYANADIFGRKVSLGLVSRQTGALPGYAIDDEASFTQTPAQSTPEASGHLPNQNGLLGTEIRFEDVDFAGGTLTNSYANAGIGINGSLLSQDTFSGNFPELRASTGAGTSYKTGDLTIGLDVLKQGVDKSLPRFDLSATYPLAQGENYDVSASLLHTEDLANKSRQSTLSVAGDYTWDINEKGLSLEFNAAAYPRLINSDFTYGARAGVTANVPLTINSPKQDAIAVDGKKTKEFKTNLGLGAQATYEEGQKVNVGPVIKLNF